MAIAIPQSIKDKIAQEEADRKARKETELQKQEREQSELKKINEMRASKKVQLESEAKFIADWLRDLWLNEESRQLFGTRTVNVFGARFYYGEPTTDRHAWAKMSLRFEFNDVIYEEVYNTSMGSGTRRVAKYELGLLDGSEWNDAINGLHPDYILKFAEAIRSGEVWKFIERSIG